MYKEFTREVIEQAREEYLKYCTARPKQFNIQLSKENGWRCEFIEGEGLWENCTLWESDPDKVIDIFFSCDPDLIDYMSWPDEYTEK